MSDLISRQPLLQEIEDNTIEGYIQMSQSEIANMIANAPSAENTGKWIPVTNGRGGFECNKCHNYAPSYQDGVEWLSDFCPNCGARME